MREYSFVPSRWYIKIPLGFNEAWAGLECSIKETLSKSCFAISLWSCVTMLRVWLWLAILYQAFAWKKTLLYRTTCIRPIRLNVPHQFYDFWFATGTCSISSFVVHRRFRRPKRIDISYISSFVLVLLLSSSINISIHHTKICWLSTGLFQFDYFARIDLLTTRCFTIDVTKALALAANSEIPTLR